MGIVYTGFPGRTVGVAVLYPLSAELLVDFPGAFGQIQHRDTFGHACFLDGFGIVAAFKGSLDRALGGGDVAACPGIIVP